MNDPLFGNKLAAAVLTALLLFFGLPQLAGALVGGGHHGGHGEVHFAYMPVDYKAGFAAAEGPVEVGPSLAEMMAEASPAVGENRIRLCASCHSFEKGGANGTGPNLWDIVGRDVASVDGFAYSAALKDFGGQWTYERLDGYLKNSQSYIPGTAMVQRVGKDKQRAEILTYLRTLSESPVAMPEIVKTEEPAPAAEEEAH